MWGAAAFDVGSREQLAVRILVINSGSSSVKFELFDMESESSLLRGEVERIGEAGSSAWSEAEGGDREEREVQARDHHEALGVVLGMLSPSGLTEGIGAVGHRVVHGGDRFARPVEIDDGVVSAISAFALLAPLHTKANVAGIDAARSWLPDVPHVAVFDTAFHQTIPVHAREYALPRALTRAHGIRRYGFHGTSHEYVARRAAVLLERPLAELDLITLHLGNGASVAAIRGGRSVDTSMGMTPLEGLVMGTRCGDIDPAVPMLLGEITGRSRESVHQLMNSESGLLGLTGESDIREVHRLADAGDEDARLALEMFCYRAKKYVGAYYAALGRADAVVFTAGIGEHDPDVRSRICAGLERLGIELDAEANAANAGDRARDGSAGDGALPGECFISVPDSEVAVLVIPTDEELEIARETLECVSGRAGRTEE